jgi:hypothetical protein
VLPLDFVLALDHTLSANDEALVILCILLFGEIDGKLVVDPLSEIRPNSLTGELDFFVRNSRLFRLVTGGVTTGALSSDDIDSLCRVGWPCTVLGREMLPNLRKPANLDVLDDLGGDSSTGLRALLFSGVVGREGFRWVADPAAAYSAFAFRAPELSGRPADFGRSAGSSRGLFGKLSTFGADTSLRCADRALVKGMRKVCFSLPEVGSSRFA